MSGIILNLRPGFPRFAGEGRMGWAWLSLVLILCLLPASRSAGTGDEREVAGEIESALAQQAIAKHEKAAALADKTWREATLRAKKALATELRAAQVAAVRGKADADAARIATMIVEVESDIRRLSDESARPTLGGDEAESGGRAPADKQADQAGTGNSSAITPAELFRSLPVEMRPPNTGEWDIVAQAKAADYLRTQFRGKLIRFRGQITQRPSVTAYNGVTRVYIFIEPTEEGIRRGALRIAIQATGEAAEAMAKNVREGETISAVAPLRSVQVGSEVSYLYVDTPLPPEGRR